MSKRIILNERSYFGRGAREELITEIKDKRFEKALIVTDDALMKSGITNMVTRVLDNNDFKYEIFQDIKQNPTVTNVLEGVEFCKNSQADFLIAVGGGSVIDTAKAIGIIMTNPEFSDVISLDGVAKTKEKALPIIAMPTTAGTAAEVTINYVITDEKNIKKMVCVDPHDIPIVSIVDQDLMDSMPPSIAASTGMDALTHAIEGYTTKDAWLMTDMFHINAMALIYKNLDRAVNNKDPHAIEQVGLGQYIAGMGFSNVGLGIVHSMAHSLGALYDTPHGVANALLLPHVLEYNGKVCPELFRNMGYAIGLDMNGLNDNDAVSNVVSAIKALSIKVGIPQTLQEIGVMEKDLEKLASQAMEDICTPGNARFVNEQNILEIYKRAYK